MVYLEVAPLSIETYLSYKRCIFRHMHFSTATHDFGYRLSTVGNRHKQNSWFCKEIREDNFRFWWRTVHEDASQGMYMSKIEIVFFTARILQNQRMLCCGEHV